MGIDQDFFLAHMRKINERFDGVDARLDKTDMRLEVIEKSLRHSTTPRASFIRW